MFFAILDLIKHLLVAGVIFYAAYFCHSHDVFFQQRWTSLVVIIYLFALGAALGLMNYLPQWCWKVIRRCLVLRENKKAGSAAFATDKDIKKAKLFKRQPFLLGLQNKRPVFAAVESSALILSPAGGGKTANYVIPKLMFDPSSMFVPDLKRVLMPMTQQYRQQHFGHRIVVIDPLNEYKDTMGDSAHYNPLTILIEAWNDPRKHNLIVGDAQAIALQICPDPKNQGENQYFRNGSRKLLVFAFLYLVIVDGNPILSAALVILSNKEYLTECLAQCQNHEALKGDFARIAIDLHVKFTEADQRQVESFREGAIQALEPYSPSGVLAEVTAATDFRFYELKDNLMTIYLLGDATRMKVFGHWFGLLSWCAITELIRHQNQRNATLLLDEITNFKIEGLAKLLTLAREYKVVLYLFVQELEEWSVTYGKESLETLLSQTQVKVFMGSRSQATCELVSKMLGNETVKANNYNMQGGIMGTTARSVSDRARPLRTPDEVRRSKKVFVIVDDKKPMELDAVGYHQIAPMRRKVGINPLYGKRYKGWLKLRLKPLKVPRKLRKRKR